MAGALAAEAAEMGARRMVLLGTAAVRDAANGDELRQAVEDATGLPMRVLGGDEEAQLSFAGARQGLEQREVERLGVVDVGGGSTELAAGGATGPADWTASVPVGSSVLCRDHPAPDPPEEAHVDAWHAAAAGALDGVDPPPRGPVAGRGRHGHLAAPADRAPPDHDLAAAGAGAPVRPPRRGGGAAPGPGPRARAAAARGHHGADGRGRAAGQRAAARPRRAARGRAAGAGRA